MPSDQQQTFEPQALVAPLGRVAVAEPVPAPAVFSIRSDKRDEYAAALDAAEVVQNQQDATAAAVPHAGDVIGGVLDRLAQLESVFANIGPVLVRIADIEQKIAPILHLVPGLAALMPIADELASIVENLNRGRVAVRG